MKNGKKTKSRLRTALTWIGWALLVQFILVNITAANYAKKLTSVYNAPVTPVTVSNDIFSKTWRLFTGLKSYRMPIADTPSADHLTVRLTTSGGKSLEGWYIRTDSVARGTVLLFHGLMGNKGMVLRPAEEFRRMGYNVFLVDVRAHGNSEGEVTTIGYREAEDVKLAMDYIRQKGERRIFLWGSSMGAVEVMRAVAELDVDPTGIIIEMPFLSLQTHLEGKARLLGFPSQPFAFLTSFWIGVERGFNGWGFRTSDYAEKIDCPVLMQYGKRDELVLPYETEKIFRSIASPTKKLVYYEEVGHTLFYNRDPETWKREVGNFLDARK